MAKEVAVQDDTREEELRTLFGLEKPEGSGRSGIDAILLLDHKEIPFELKSTTKSGVTTVRDFGPAHIKKWQGKHWLFGFYEADGQTLKYTLYGSPQMMDSWIRSKWDYVKPDFDLAEIMAKKISLDLEDLYNLVGRKGKYDLSDARNIQKKQYTIAEYRDMMDMHDGLSPKKMLEILSSRCRYLLQRGSTLNNPHIPKSFFEGWEKIRENHQARLRELVRQAIS